MNNQTLKHIIDDVYDNLKSNKFDVLGENEIKLFGRPDMGVSSGDDPYFDFLKEHIGSFHWSPIDAFKLKYSEGAPPAKLRVVSLVFPQSDFAKEAQRNEDIHPSDRWLVSRGKWEGLMAEFSGEVVRRVEAEGVKIVSIDLQPEFSRHDSKNLGIASRWSHRHYAYASGLGTFGLSDGFISRFGKAIRITSYVIEADLDLTSDNRPGVYDWCLYYSSGKCGACVGRCPVNAISVEGHDKAVCASYEDVCVGNYWPEHLERGNWMFGCGLCQVNVPCQNKAPIPLSIR